MRHLLVLLFERVPILATLITFLLCLLFGFLGIFEFAEEVQFSSKGRRAIAQVEQYISGRKGSGNATVIYPVEGRNIRTQMPTFLFWPSAGEEVRILYLPDKSYYVIHDSFWRRFGVPTVSLVLAAIFLLWVVRDIRFRFRVTGVSRPN
jgi:hypothetical protein